MAEQATAQGELLGLVTPALRREVAVRLRTISALRNRMLLSVGQTTKDVFFLSSGEVHVVLYSPDGRIVTVQTVRAPAMFGELAAIDDQPRSASVIAATEVTLARMAQADFLRCLEDSPAAALWLARRMAVSIRRLTDQVFELSALSVGDRIRCELLRLANAHLAEDTLIRISPAPTHAEIASRVGTHREAVTRELNLLAEEGILRHGRRWIEVVDLGRLAASAISAEH
ncbi:Crp/Fnr family transcriptional regulator [Sphingomonas sp. HF-S4]|uniref:Crp/Fnr family transcriptional regulator n=1 Tax=Sphingomonas agrestis TaxID=3080540 RepID=A0ABU3Y965_9SPHN|nr:Crp/Fnr family transcriptional regulator [Sphingomonas sp. HF-S4]MDV3457926.1 Crp/Fnr family transcriptional regulator [Sphingomonas sp. HF-S4]